MFIPSGQLMASARISGGRMYRDIRGVVRFFQTRDGVLVAADISGLPRSADCEFLGFHIHRGGECTGEEFSGTLGHFDPAGRMHPQHAGDLPPLLSCSGRAYMVVRTDRFRISDIIGRTVVIHSRADDFRSQPAGDAGEKIACGVIRRA